MTPRPIHLLLLLTMLLVTNRAAHAELQPGEQAPTLGASGYVGAARLTLAGLRGRIVLLEFFSTRCSHCKRHVAQLNALQARYGRRGLTVLAVTRDALSKAERFARTQRARYPIAVAGIDTQRAYLVQRYPAGCLISAYGDVLWSGSATKLPESEIVRALQRARPQPAYGLAQRWIAQGLEVGRYAATRKRIAGLLRCRPEQDAECRTVHAAYAWIDAYATARLARATELRVLERYYDAWRVLDEVRRWYEGAPESRRATAVMEELLASPARRREVAAGRALAVAVGTARRLVSTQAAILYENVALRFRGTQAAALAQRKATTLRKKKR